jgi:aldose 1-epimerase
MPPRRMPPQRSVVLASSQLQATFVPGAAMVCCSLRHNDVELLAQRDGVRAYAQRGSTQGIPLLYPWANRLARLSYPGEREPVVLSREDPLLKLDANGLPIHGAMPRALAWELLEAPRDGALGDGHGHRDDDGGQTLSARLRWDRPQLLALFPFTHTLALRARVDDATLTIETSVHADGDVAVPVSFGYHPYLTLPGADRSAWQVDLPVSRRLTLDERMIPTGAGEPFEHRRFQLADGDWDDAFAGLLRPTVFSVSAGERRIELQFHHGYSHAQVYAPAGQQFICFEPMTAPTNALVSRDELPIVQPGEVYRAAFSVSVSARA